MRILDRYILKNFLEPFLYCFFGFIAIWLVFDFAQHSGDFLTFRASGSLIVQYYKTQIPQVIVLMLPVALLLSLLFSLSKMSRSNEIISMLAAGLSLVRIAIPFLFVGLAVTAGSFAMNRKLAPRADAAKKKIMEQIASGTDWHSIVNGQLFRNRADNRTWFMQTLLLNKNEVRGLHITQQDGQGNIIRKYYAACGMFDPMGKTWNFTDGKTVDFDAGGKVSGEENWTLKKIGGWSETPWRIMSATMEAQNLSLSELRQYLRINADFPDAQLAPYRTYLYYRWAEAATCLIVIFIAVPLGIVYSRRGVLAGVAGSIFIFFGMIFLDKLFLALGKGDRIPAQVAAWGPNAIFAIVGFFLLYMRSTNRDMSDLNPWKFFHRTKHA
jgi:lipopolysaccharide export system permease protein